MPAEPTEPESLDEFLDDVEKYDADDTGEAPAEVAPEDAAEQRAELLRRREVPLTGRSTDDANPADVDEQARIVEPDDDEYDR